MNGSSSDGPAARVDRRTVVVAVAVVVVLAGCSGGEDASPAGVRLTGSTAFDPDREGPAPPIDGAVRGGTVSVLGALDPRTAAYAFSSLDPTLAYAPQPLSVLQGLVTRSLTQYVFDPDQGAMVLVPDLATDLGTPNEDFTRWTYTIRDGVRFEDGTEVTAADVAFGIKRSFDRPTFEEVAPYSTDFFLHGDTYQGPYTSGTDYDGIEVEGNTLILKMERPFPDMPYWGAFPAMGPIHERRSDPPAYGRHPLATGPYKVEEFTPRESLTLVRNQEWDPDTDPGRHAYPDKYVFTFTERPETIDSLILGDSERGQTTVSLSGVLSHDFARAQKLDRVVVGSGPCTYMWFPDYRKIKELEVRQALGYAYPYARVSKALGLISGLTELPGTSLFPPGFPGRQDYNPLEVEPGQTDPAKARVLLREAGYAPGEYEISFVSYPDQAVPEKVYVTSLEAAGFKVSPYPVPTADDARKVVADPRAPINIRFGGWCTDWPSGGSMFRDLFYSDTPPTDGGYFAEPVVDAEIEQIERLPFQDQPAAWGALDKTVMTDYYPVVVTRYQAAPVLHGSRIGGANVDNVGDMPTWKDIYIVQ
jgi:peptide/nickel transport system substrate-binding protein